MSQDFYKLDASGIACRCTDRFAIHASMFFQSTSNLLLATLVN